MKRPSYKLTAADLFQSALISLALTLALSASCSAAGKRDAHVVVDRVVAACVVIARSLDPGAEVLCATAAELTDAIIEMTRKKQGIAAMATPYDPEDARLELFETVKARRAAGAVVEPKGKP